MKRDSYTCSKGEYDFSVVATKPKQKSSFFISYSLIYNQHGLDAQCFKPASVLKFNHKAVERKRAAQSNFWQSKGAFCIIIKNSVTEIT